MRIDVVTLFPELVGALRGGGVTGRALSNGIAELGLWNPREYSTDRHRSVDDRPYGGGPGMLMAFAPLRAAIEAARVNQGGDAKTIYMTPQGRRLDQAAVVELARTPRLIVVAGRYEGVDERLIEAEVDEEWSIGDYVLSGGELAAMVLIDALVRHLPGALGHEDSAIEDSFSGGLLDCPHYTRPEVAAGRRVPEVLLSGNHEAIRRWRLKQALGRTWQRRPDLLNKQRLDEEQRALLREFIAEHDAAVAAGHSVEDKTLTRSKL